MRHKHRWVWLVSCAILTISVAPAFAQGRGRGHGNGRSHEGNRSEEHGRGHASEHRAAFTEHDRETIVSYYKDHRSDLPPGLARRGTLPPGLQKQLRRNGHLPPGLQKRIVWFPAALNRQLPPVPQGYRRCWIGNNALVVNVRTFGILDVALSFRIP